MVIFSLIQRFFILNSYYKSRMAVCRSSSRLVIMIWHDSFSFSYNNFNSHTVIIESHVVIFQSQIVISQSYTLITETR